LPQGWSKAYEFSIGDLRAGAMVLDAVAKSSNNTGGGELDFKLIHGLMEVNISSDDDDDDDFICALSHTHRSDIKLRQEGLFRAALIKFAPTLVSATLVSTL
jgi:hypothetical protein